MTETKQDIPKPFASAVALVMLAPNWWLRVTAVRLYFLWFVALPFGTQPIDQIQAFALTLLVHVLKGAPKPEEPAEQTGRQILKNVLNVTVFYLLWIAIGWVVYHAFFPVGHWRLK